MALCSGVLSITENKRVQLFSYLLPFSFIAENGTIIN